MGAQSWLSFYTLFMVALKTELSSFYSDGMAHQAENTYSMAFKENVYQSLDLDIQSG